MRENCTIERSVPRPLSVTEISIVRETEPRLVRSKRNGNCPQWAGGRSGQPNESRTQRRSMFAELIAPAHTAFGPEPPTID